MLWTPGLCWGVGCHCQDHPPTAGTSSLPTASPGQPVTPEPGGKARVAPQVLPGWGDGSWGTYCSRESSPKCSPVPRTRSSFSCPSTRRLTRTCSTRTWERAEWGRGDGVGDTGQGPAPHHWGGLPGAAGCRTHLSLQDDVKVFPLVSFVDNDVAGCEGALGGGGRVGRQGTGRGAGSPLSASPSPTIPAPGPALCPQPHHGLQAHGDLSQPPQGPAGVGGGVVPGHPPPPWHPAACRGGCRRGPAASAPCGREGPAGVPQSACTLPAPCLHPAWAPAPRSPAQAAGRAGEGDGEVQGWGWGMGMWWQWGWAREQGSDRNRDWDELGLEMRWEWTWG